MHNCHFLSIKILLPIHMMEFKCISISWSLVINRNEYTTVSPQFPLTLSSLSPALSTSAFKLTETPSSLTSFHFNPLFPF